MNPLNWLRWMNQERSEKHAQRARRRSLQQKVRLAMQRLEDRIVPTNVFWNVNHDGFWDVPGNWSTNTVPVAGDDVTIDQTGPLTVSLRDDRAVNTIQTNGASALSHTGGSFTIAAASQLDGAYSQSGGTLTAAVGLTLANAANQFTGGTIAGSVTLNGSLAIGPGTVETLSGILANAGTITNLNNPADSYGFHVAGNGALNNLAGGLIDFQTDLGVSGAGYAGAGVLNNAGTVRKSAGTSGFTDIQIPFNNASGGTIVVDAGTLKLTGGGVSTGGTLIANQNAALVLVANNVTETLNGVYTGSGAGSVQLVAGTINVASGADTTFNFPAGLFNWLGGTLAAGTGLFTNAGFITLGSETVETLSGTLNNAGTITDANVPNGGFSQGLLLSGSGVLNNLTGGLFDIQNDSQLQGTTFSGAGTFNNAGTVRKSVTAGGFTEIGIAFNNAPSGTIVVGAGTLRLTGGGVSTGGTFNANANAALVLIGNGVSETLNGAYTGSGAGSVQLVAGTVNVANGADTTFNFPTGLFNWSGGTLAAGNGRFTNTGFVTLNSSAVETLTGTLNNAGTIIDANVPNGGFSQGFLMDGSGVLNNLASGLFDIQNDSQLQGSVYNGTGAFKNAGTLRKSGGLNVTQIGTPLNNFAGGIIEVQTGTLRLLGGGTSTGGNFIARDSALLILSNGSVLNGAYTGSGAGAIQIVGGAVSVASGADTTFNFPAGLFNWSGGTVAAGNGRFTNAGFITLNSSAVETLTGTLNNAGTIIDANVPNGGFSQGFLMDGSGVLNNLASGLFDIQNDSQLQGSGSNGTGAFKNAGTLRKSGGSGGITEIYAAFDNTLGATVDAASGTLRFSGAIAQVSGTTFVAGGAWVADANSILDLQSAPALTTNQASVTFNGVGARFPKLNSLVSNAGALDFLGGADFAFPASLINTGTIAVGPGTTFALPGNYTQTAAGTLNIQVGGTQVSGQFGRLSAAGQTTLGGTLAITLVNGFGPTAGQTYPIMTYAGHSGDFATITGLGDGRRNFFSETTNPTGVTLNAILNSADLAVSQIAALPPTGVVGQNVTINFTVQNLSATPATGSWVDSVYLSANGTFNPNNLLLGRVTHTGDVAGNGSYTGTLTAPLPAVLGAVNVVVVADSRGLVPDTNRTNNVKVTVDAINATVTSLALGASVTGTIATGQDVYYRVDVPSGQDVQLTFTGAVAGEAELYERFQSLPDRATFDQLAFAPNGTNQQIVLSGTQAGVYYVLLHGREGAGGGQSFMLAAAVLPLQVRGFEPTSGSNAGTATLTVSGDYFSPTTNVTLVAGGVQRAASAVIFKNSTTLFATFDLTGLTPGSFNIRVNDGAQMATASAAFTVTASVPGRLVFSLETQSVIRPGQPGTTVVIHYGNPSGVDVAATAISLQSDNARFRLPGQTSWIDDQITLLAINNTGGPAGILPPGTSGAITVEFQPKTVGVHTFSHFYLRGEYGALVSSIVDWSSLQATLQPVGEPNDAWNVVFANLTAKLGNTVESIQAVLSRDATYLSSLGETVPSFDQLLGYEILQADAFGAISARYTLGALGRGIPDPTDLSATADADGNVTLRTGGLTRSFYPFPAIDTYGNSSDPLGNFYQGDPGDFAILNQVGTHYELCETDGTLRVYNPDGTFAYTQDTSGNRVAAVYAGGKITGFTDSFGNATTYAYNAQGRIASITDSPDGHVATLTYDASGEHLVSVTDDQGTASFTYVTGQGIAREHAVASITYRDGSHRFFTYDSQGRPIHEESDGGAQAFDVGYDPVGRVTTTDATGAKTVVEPNEFAQIAAVIDPLGRVTEATFDSNHQVTVLSGSGGVTTTTSYDFSGNPISTADTLGRRSNQTFDDPASIFDGSIINPITHKRLVFTNRRSDPLIPGPTLPPTFNGLTNYSDSMGHALAYDRDAQGRLVGVTFADGSSTRYTYDAKGQATAKLNRNGQLTGYTYDPNGLLLRETFADGTHNDYTYDARQNPMTISDATGTTTFVYDAADRLTSVAYPNGHSLTFTYDAAGRRQSMTDPTGAGFTTNYAYDAVGRLRTLTDGMGATLAVYTYDAVGRLSRVDNGNGTATTHTRNALGQVLSLVNLAPNGSVQSRFDYTYDALGRPVTMTTLAGTFTYTTDASGQLTSVIAPGGRTITYQYDLAGNRVSAIDTGVTTAYAVNNLNEYTSAGQTAYTYDKAGNLTTRQDANGTTTYSYNLQGYLAGIVGPTDTWSYAYNALGQRVSVTHNGLTTAYVIDPTGLGNVAAEYAAGSGLVAHYVQGLGLAGRVDATGAAAYYGFDGSGNTAQLTGAGGTTLDAYSYLPFGEQISATGTTPNPFTFVGQSGVQDDGSGLYYMRNRYYSPSQGRFTSADPLGLAGGTNLYQYAENSPLQITDPSGLCPGPTAEQQFQQQFDRGTNLINAANASANNKVPITDTHNAAATVGGAFLTELPGALGDGAASTAGGAALTAAGGTAATAQGLVLLLGKREQLRAVQNLPELNGGAAPNPSGDCPPSIPPAFHKPPPFLGKPPSWINWRGNRHGHANLNLQNPLSNTQTEQRTSNDPNEITGPAGFGPQGFVQPNQTFPYTIFFQNQPTASAPAQVVTITQQLDSNLDLSTFQLGTIGFGSISVPVPVGRTSFSTRVDVRDPVGGFFVDITAGVNLLTGLATWTFTSIDPKTLDVPIPVLEGFLPPDVAAPEGEGFVSYTVRPKTALPTGTAVNAQATIVFDTNAALDTAPIFNTVDRGAPTSSVAALPAVESSASFLVSWSGQDDAAGSGIATFDIEVSDNGGPFAPFLTGTTQTSATFIGVPGHTYGFTSVATDNVANRQATPSAAQASTTIRLATSTTLTATPQATTGGTLVTFTATIAPNPGNFGTVSFLDNGQPIAANVAVASGVATFQIATLSAGSHPITAAYSGAIGFAASGSSILNFSVTAAATTTSLTGAAPNPALLTQSIALTVTVGGNSTNGGTVTILDANDGNAVVPTTGGILSGGSASLTIGPGQLTVGTHNLVAVYAGNGFNNSSQSAALPVVVAAVPQVMSVTPNGNILSLSGVQRSRVVSLQVVFNQPVQLDANALTVALHANGVVYNGVAGPFGVVPTNLVLSSADNVTWIVTFDGNTDPLPNLFSAPADNLQSIQDGVYDFNVDASKVHPAGVPTISAAANSTTVFDRLFGDVTGEEPAVGNIHSTKINTTDNLDFRAAFNSVAGAPGTLYKPFFDFDGDGQVNTTDNLQFRARFNQPLTWSV